MSWRGYTRPTKLLLLGVVVLIALGLMAPTGLSAEGKVMIMDLEGPINPGTATFMTRGLEEASDQGATLVIIRLDTPGGLASSMRTMVKAILNSPIPVVVYVAPRGAGAACRPRRDWPRCARWSIP